MRREARMRNSGTEIVNVVRSFAKASAGGVLLPSLTQQRRTM